MHVAENAKWPSSETRFKWVYCKWLHQIRRSLWVIVCQLIYQWQWSCDFLWGKWAISFWEQTQGFLMLPCHCSGATVWFRGSHIPSWIELLPPISSIFHRRLDFFSFAAVTLTTSQETGPPLTYDLLWPWSGVTVLSRHPQKSQIRSGVIKVTFLDKESRASDTSVRCVLEAQPQHSWAIKKQKQKKNNAEKVTTNIFDAFLWFFYLDWKFNLAKWALPIRIIRIFQLSTWETDQRKCLRGEGL